MRLDSEIDAVLDAWRQSLADFLPARFVQRGLVDPADLPPYQLEAGVICLIGRGGGGWANWQGREGELGTVQASLVGFVVVPETSAREEVEQAELGLLQDLLDWFRAPKASPLGTVYPGDFRQSQQLEHPWGWLHLQCEARHV